MTERRNNPSDPTAERTADGSTQTASGLSADRDGPGVERARNDDQETIGRDDEDARSTPRQDVDPAADPVMPSDDASLGTKI